MLTFIVIFLFLTAAIFDSVTLLQHKKTKVKVLYFSLLSVAFCVLLLYSLGIMAPSPAPLIAAVIDALFHRKG